MTLYNVFDTESEAQAAQDYDFQTLLAASTNEQYKAETERWDFVRYYDVGNVWYYYPCPTSDAVYNTQDINFPPEEPL